MASWLLRKRLSEKTRNWPLGVKMITIQNHYPPISNTKLDQLQIVLALPLEQAHQDDSNDTQNLCM